MIFVRLLIVLTIAPVLGRYKVYIIDEVHMLSKNAFNALLKTLEEPPEHVKFIFATTEIQRIPVTVLSRCQRFDLRRVEASSLEKHLRSICEQEKVNISDEGLKIIVRASEGSVRDSLSMLDQVIAFSGDMTIEAHDVRSTLGLADRSRVENLFTLVMAGQIAEALEEFVDQCTSGAEPIIILSDLLEYSHLLTRMHVAPQAMKNVSDDFDLPSAERIAHKLNVPSLTCAWQVLLKGIEDVRKAPRPVSAAEMVLIRLAYASTLPSPAEIVRKVHNMAGGSAQEQTSRSAGQALQGSFDAAPLDSTPLEESAPHQPAAAVNHSEQGLVLMSFDDVIMLAEQKKELRLAFNLKDSVRLVAFDGTERRIEIGLTEKAEQSIVQNLRAMLHESTGHTWNVVVSDQLGDATKYQQEATAKEVLREKVMNHALVVDIFKKFPDAQLNLVQEASDHNKLSWGGRAENEAYASENIELEDDDHGFLMNQ